MSVPLPRGDRWRWTQMPNKFICPYCGRVFPGWYWDVPKRLLGTIKMAGLARANFGRHKLACQPKETKMKRPDHVEAEHLLFMDAVRAKGVTNPLAAGSTLEEMFELTRRQAREIVLYWRHSFDERHFPAPIEKECSVIHPPTE